MSYFKKQYRDIIEKIDKELKLPKKWNEFVKKEAEKDNLIIKTKGICHCKNCGTSFKSNKKINEIEKCPNCKNEYLIKRRNYQWHNFEDRTLVLLDRLDSNWIVRLFVIQTVYAGGNIRHSDAIEYGRVVFPEDLNFVNNRVFCHMYGTEKVFGNQKIKRWREYHHGYQRLSCEGKLFPYNLKKLFANTEYQYSQLWTLAKKEECIDISYYLNNNLPSTELLIKMKLYKLAFCPKTFNIKGSFEKRFGIDKSYYPFMKKNNIDIDELDILKLFKRKNIKAIRFLKKYRLDHLKILAKYMSMDKLIKFIKGNSKFDMDLYIDYIRFLEILNIDLKDKKNLFPDNIKEEHDKYEMQVQILEVDENTRNHIQKRYNELEKYIFSHNQYFIVPVKNMQELVDESRQQRNCVRNYTKAYSEGECDLYFMREKETPKQSLVTVEVKNRKVVQSRVKFNGNVNTNQKRFLDLWEKKVLKVV